jgi:glycosyltransferase 2 family protein
MGLPVHDGTARMKAQAPGPVNADDVDLAEAPVTPPGRGLLKGVVRVAVGVAVIAFLLWRSDTHALAKAIGDARPGYIAGALVLMFGVLVVGAFRWQQFLRPLGLALRAGTLLRMYFVGTFFNAFLPTGVGGDAYKAVRLGKGPGEMSRSFASVFLDRLAGMTGLALLGLVAAAIRLADGDRSAVVVIAAVLGLGILVAAAVVVGFGERLARRADVPGRWGVRQKLGRTLAAMARAGRDPRAGTLGLAGGVLTQMFLVGVQVLLAKALGLPLSIPTLTAILVITTVASAIPLSINGLGFREGSYVWALGLYGVGHNVALAFALLMLALLLISSAVGGIVYVVAGGEVDATHPRHALAPDARPVAR